MAVVSVVDVQAVVDRLVVGEDNMFQIIAILVGAAGGIALHAYLRSRQATSRLKSAYTQYSTTKYRVSSVVNTPTLKPSYSSRQSYNTVSSYDSSSSYSPSSSYSSSDSGSGFSGGDSGGGGSSSSW